MDTQRERQPEELERVYLISLSGEITYRARGSRRYFTRRTIRNLREALRRQGDDAEIRRRSAKIEVYGEFDPQLCARIFGVKHCVVAHKLHFEDLDELAHVGERLWRDTVAGKTFGVKCHRVGDHPFTSQDVGAAVGARLDRYADGVDLTAPDVWVEVEIRHDEAYFIDARIDGPAGLPIGVGDDVLVLFSGGYDSPVATWHLAKRGARPHFVHFAFGSLAEAKTVFRVARYLRTHWLTGAQPTFVLVPFAEVVGEIIDAVASELRQVTLRRAMYQAAERIALERGYEVLITGEALSQATSQTLRNLRAEEQGIDLPILRPLISWDKEEIIDASREIGTYDLSMKVNELCSIAQGPVSARVDLDEFTAAYRRLDPATIEAAVDRAIVLDFSESDEQVAALLEEDAPTIPHIPGDAVVVNLMPEQGSMPNAIPYAQFEEAEFRGDGTPLILVCRRGVTSVGMARILREKGLNAYSYEGGYERYRRLTRTSKGSRS